MNMNGYRKIYNEIVEDAEAKVRAAQERIKELETQLAEAKLEMDQAVESENEQDYVAASFKAKMCEAKIADLKSKKISIAYDQKKADNLIQTVCNDRHQQIAPKLTELVTLTERAEAIVKEINSIDNEMYSFIVYDLLHLSDFWGLRKHSNRVNFNLDRVLYGDIVFFEKAREKAQGEKARYEHDMALFTDDAAKDQAERARFVENFDMTEHPPMNIYGVFEHEEEIAFERNPGVDNCDI